MRLVSILPALSALLLTASLQAGTCEDYLKSKIRYHVREVTRPYQVNNSERAMIRAAVLFSLPGRKSLTADDAIRIFFDTFNHEQPAAGAIYYYPHPSGDSNMQIVRVSYHPDDKETGLLYEINGTTEAIGSIQNNSIHCN